MIDYPVSEENIISILKSKGIVLLNEEKYQLERKVIDKYDDLYKSFKLTLDTNGSIHSVKNGITTTWLSKVVFNDKKLKIHRDTIDRILIDNGRPLSELNDIYLKINKK